MSTPPAAVARLPLGPGVYRFRGPDGRVLYVGRATSLRARVRSYWGDLRGRGHLRRMLPQVTRVEAVCCASVHEAAWLERNLLERSLPRWNRVVGGADVPLWLTLDPGPDRPGLRLVDIPAPGRPVLGADRARLARSALLRIWPVHLTGRRLDRADASLAEARGVDPGRRDEYVAALSAALAGDPSAGSALRAGLVASRDRAVAGLAFEVAQQIQLELAAAEWLLAEQRVTGCAPEDLAVHGWADGVLFSLTAAAGRLDRWTVRTTSAASGRRLADETPDAWRTFADENAELAARLRA